ncbi:Cerato-platanin [Penicillium verhagenii]|uniref:Cerato-platanin n=1 Tax=Penicillium verhagenii TaxID=1562060 RepID=UPI002545622D|nr:Cerato-platanin [Penicillium verhagenii]KAJ5923861.1 Cerato-platanin [Penicillium verhagenii]
MKSITAITCTLLTAAHLVSAVPAPQAATTPVDSNDTTGQSVSVSYDQKYDVGTSSLNTVACSDGANGLESDDYTTFGSLPTFPLIGGAPTIDGWNSSACGTCYQLHFQSGKIDETINILAIDAATGGFNIGLTAMNRLTNGQAENLGRVTATYFEVDGSICGLSSEN